MARPAIRTFHRRIAMVQKPDFYRDVVPVVSIRAKLVFQGKPDADEHVSDAISVAWQALLNAPQAATPQSIAVYACLHVKMGRQFRQSTKSIDGPNPRRRRKPRRKVADVGKVLARERNNPAALATVKMDFTAWLPLLTPKEQRYLEAFLSGETTKEIADRFEVTTARVSQVRRKLWEHWKAFTDS
jgi:DNA-binding NarL/FixJ family response regulator